MSLVIVTGDGPEHRYVTNRIAAAHDVAAIFVCDPPARRGWQTVLRKSPVQFIDKSLRQLYLHAIDDARVRATSLRRILGPSCDVFDRHNIVVRVGRPKSGLLSERVAALQPEVIAVYGTGIIPDDVIRTARTVALNMHTGLSPWYRGTACAFWPLVEGEPERIGATVHECSAVVDGGRIFFTGRAELFRGDDLHAIFARAVRVGAEGYAEVVADAHAGTLFGEPQDLTIGREYTGAMLGLRAEYAARRALRRLSEDWPQERNGT